METPVKVHNVRTLLLAKQELENQLEAKQIIIDSDWQYVKSSALYTYIIPGVLTMISPFRFIGSPALSKNLGKAADRLLGKSVRSSRAYRIIRSFAVVIVVNIIKNIPHLVGKIFKSSDERKGED